MILPTRVPILPASRDTQNFQAVTGLKFDVIPLGAVKRDLVVFDEKGLRGWREFFGQVRNGCGFRPVRLAVQQNLNRSGFHAALRIEASQSFHTASSPKAPNRLATSAADRSSEIVNCGSATSSEVSC